MSVRFTPPFPRPHVSKSSVLLRFVRGWNSWIHVLFEKSYTMKMGEIHTPALSYYIANELPLVRRIMDTDAALFPKHRHQRELLDPLIGGSVFSANGQDWADQREMVHPAFGHTALKRVFPLMAAAVDDLVERLRGAAAAGPIAIDPFMTHVAADIIYRTLFSERLGLADGREIHDAFHAYQRNAQRAWLLRLYRLPQLGFDRRARRAARRIHAVFEPLVLARHAGRDGRREDILQALIDARHPRTGAAFTPVELMEQVSTIFLAGHETAASAMTWALYLAARDGPTQDAIRAETTAAAGVGT
ncbi:MAG TPA: cytochrome P450, partial [Sphingomonas sp.]